MGGKAQSPALPGQRGPGPLENGRWEAFCYFVVFGDQGVPMTRMQAFIKAGYTSRDPNRVSQVGKNPLVRARIAQLQEERKALALSQQLYTRSNVIHELLENIRESKKGFATHGGKVVYLKDPDGALVLDELEQPIPLMKRDARSINQALELLGRELGMFPMTSKLEHTRSDPFQGLSLKEILMEARNQMSAELGWDVPLQKLLDLVLAEQPIDVALLPEKANAE